MYASSRSSSVSRSHASDEVPKLRDLWVVRHSVAHNGGFVTRADARRLRSAELRDRQVLIDLPYLEQAADLLRSIVERLESLVGPALWKRWFAEGATRSWADDEDDYRRLKLLTTYVRSRPRDLPTITESMYAVDLAAHG